MNTDNQESIILEGHEDVILSSDMFSIGDGVFVVASGSKDSKVLVHRVDLSTERCELVAILTGHTGSITAVHLFNYDKAQQTIQVVSSSTDTTMKLWKVDLVTEDEGKAIVQTTSLFTCHMSHSKDINSMDVSKNDAYLATASQDRTAKMWKLVYKNPAPSTKVAHSLQLIGTLKGHKRGVWDLKFSPVEAVLATCSSDGSARIWGVSSLQCLETFDVSENSS